MIITAVAELEAGLSGRTKQALGEAAWRQSTGRPPPKRLAKPAATRKLTVAPLAQQILGLFSMS
jgi:hypothetical protein